MDKELDYNKLVKMIGLYRLGKDRPYIVPLSEIDPKHIQLQNCYKISLYWGQRTQFGEHQKNGDNLRKNSFRYQIVEKIDSYYLGKEVQKSKVTSLKYFDFKPGEETCYIQLPSGQFMQVSDNLMVVDPVMFFGSKLTDMYADDFYPGLD